MEGGRGRGKEGWMDRRNSQVDEQMTGWTNGNTLSVILSNVLIILFVCLFVCFSSIYLFSYHR